MPFSGREIAFSGREKTMGMGISPVDSQQGCILLCSMEQLHRLRSPPLWFSRPLMCRCIRPDRQWFCPHLYAELRKKLTTNGQLREIFFGLYNLSRRVCQGELRQSRKRRCPGIRPRHTACKFIYTDFTVGANTPTTVGVQQATAAGGSYRVGVFAHEPYDFALSGRTLCAPTR